MLSSKTVSNVLCSSSRFVAPRPLTASTVRVFPANKAGALKNALPARMVTSKATAEESTTVSGTTAAVSDNFVPICRPEDLPKGVRKEVEVDGRQALVFWYRNEIYAIQARSPAEGAYSEGFMKAKFTQDYGIECPGTGSVFSLKDGSVITWYPNNPVMRALTPANLVPPMEIYPVKLTQDAVMIDVSMSGILPSAYSSKGGADTSLESNNVFSVMPTVYFEGMDPTMEEANLYQEPVAQGKIDPAILAISVAALAAVGVSGTLVCLYLENLTLLAAFWLALGSLIIYNGYKLLNPEVKN